MRISDWSSDVCSSDLGSSDGAENGEARVLEVARPVGAGVLADRGAEGAACADVAGDPGAIGRVQVLQDARGAAGDGGGALVVAVAVRVVADHFQANPMDVGVKAACAVCGKLD